MCHTPFSASPPPPRPLAPWPRSLTQLEVSVQDASLVQVLESRKDLPQVVAHFGLQQGVPGLPDVGQGLQRTTASVPGPPSLALPQPVFREEETGSPALDPLTPNHHPSPSGCRAPRKCICCRHPRSDARNARCGGAAGRGAAQSHLGSAMGVQQDRHPSGAPTPPSPPRASSARPGPEPTFSR